MFDDTVYDSDNHAQIDDQYQAEETTLRYFGDESAWERG